MPSASYGYVGVGVETVPGTSVAPTGFLPVKSVNFNIDQEDITFREIAGSRQAQQSFAGSIRPSVSITSALYPSKAYGLLLQALFGAVVSGVEATSPTAKRHVFGDAATLPSLSFERSDSAVAGQGLIHQRLPGCKVESISFSAEFGSDVEIQMEAQGLTFPEKPSSKPGAGTILLPTMSPFIFSDLEIEIDGAPSNLFKSINFDFTNTLEPQETLRKTRNAYAIHEGPLECTLSGTMVYEDNSIYDKFADASDFAVVARFESEVIDVDNNIRYAIEFRWPKVKVNNFDIPMEAEGVMEADVEFGVSYDKVTKKFVEVTLINLDASLA